VKSEQRLLLAMALTFGVLVFWSSITPTNYPTTRSNPEKSLEQAALPPSPIQKIEPMAEELLEIEAAPFRFGIGTIRGGIRNLRVDSTHLLSGSEPAFLEVELLKPEGERLRFQTLQAGGKLVSKSEISDVGAEITRTISKSDIDADFLLDIKLIILNNGSKTQNYKLRMTTYRPLLLGKPEDQQYGHGFARSLGETRPLNVKKGGALSIPGSPVWITAQGRSHAIILQPVPPVGMFHVEHFNSEPNEVVGWLEFPEIQLAPGGQAAWDFHLYAGPLTPSYLEKAGLADAITFGTFSEVSRFILKILPWAKEHLGSYGWAIIFLSVSAWLIFFPVTWFGYKATFRTMEKMAALKPKMARIRKEFAKNPEKIQKEIMELHRQHGVNPLSGCLPGCLPMLLQIPVYIGLFQALNRAPELDGERFFIFRDLSAPDALISFGKMGVNLLPLFAAAAMFLQQQLSKQPTEWLSEEEKTQQKIMGWIFPAMFTLMFYSLPSGFLIYYVVNTALIVSQQFLAKKVHKRQ